MEMQALVGSEGGVGEGGKLGWNVQETPKNARIVEESPNFCVVWLPGDQKMYCLNAFPVLSWEEERLLCDVQWVFQRREGKAKRQSLGRFFKRYCLQNLILLEKKQVGYLLPILERQLFGFGPLELILADDAIEEIAVIGIGKGKPVFVFHRQHGWLQTNLFFSSELHVKDLVNKMARPTGRRLSMNSPVLNATLPDGNRLSAAINPISFTGPSLTIRKFRQQPFTPVQLVLNKAFSPDLMAFMWLAMQCDCSVLVAGNTGSGKTSSLNALLSFVPRDERIVVVEETPEIRLQHSHFVKLNVVKEQAIGMQHLIVESLRMRPDRIVVGEVRSREEVGAFIDTMLAGQGKGSYATFHGQSVRETVNRLRCLGVLQTDLAAIDLVLVQRRWNIQGREGNKEVRRVVEAAELCEVNGRLRLNTLFKYDYAKSRLLRENESIKVFEKAVRSFPFKGRGGQKEGFRRELEKRSRFLQGQGKEMTAGQLFRKVSNF